MVHYEVSLLNKSTFEGKKVLVQAHNESEAFKKATSMQSFPRKWATILAKVQSSGPAKFRHKGLRNF